MLKKFLLYIIIYIAFLQSIFPQKITLKVDGKTVEETTIIDSVDYKKNHINFKSIEDELTALQNKLQKKGFLQNEISTLKKENDTTFLAQLSLNEKTNTIYIYYNKEDVSKDLLDLISDSVNENYFTLKINNIETSLNFINSEIAKKGFPFSYLKLTEIKKKNDNSLEANLIVSENANERLTNKIIIKGYDKFPRSFLKHYLKIKPNDVFDLNTIKSKTENLTNLTFVSQKKTPEVLFTNDSTHLYLYLEKKISNTFDGFLGFKTNEDSNKVEFDGFLNLNLINNLNFGESISLTYKSDENDQKTFDITTNLPYILKSPLGIELGLNIFKRDSSFTITSQEAKVFYQFNSKNNLAIGVNSVQSENLLSQNNTEAIKDYTSSFFNLRHQYTNRTNSSRLFRIRSLFQAELGLGQRELAGTSEDQTNFKINTFNIFQLNSKNSIYIRLNGAGLLSDTYLENELYRIGGINSIRGFEENSINTSLYGLINTEYRIQLDNNIYIHSIFDASYLENDLINQKEKLFGFGFGFGIITKSGLLKFNYANGKKENTPFQFRNSKIHVSFNTVF